MASMGVFQTLRMGSKCGAPEEEKSNEGIFDISKMTEIQAYTIARDLWKFLAENPKKNKSEWEHYKFYCINKMVSGCPLCQFYRKTWNGTCNDCYLQTRHVCTIIEERNQSPIDSSYIYAKWNNAKDAGHITSAQRYATQIYDIIDEKYEELLQNEHEYKKEKYKYTNE